MHKALARTFTKLSRALSREARRFCQRSPAGQTTWSQDSLSIFIYVYIFTDRKHSEPWAHAGYETFLILRGPRAVVCICIYTYLYMYIRVKGSEPWAVVGYESLHILRGPRARNPILTDKPPKGDRRFRGRGKVSQRIHKLILQSVRKACTRAFTKHSQDHSQSTHKSLRKALLRTITKLSQERS